MTKCAVDECIYIGRVKTGTPLRTLRQARQAHDPRGRLGCLCELGFVVAVCFWIRFVFMCSGVLCKVPQDTCFRGCSASLFGSCMTFAVESKFGSPGPKTVLLHCCEPRKKAMQCARRSRHADALRPNSLQPLFQPHTPTPF